MKHHLNHPVFVQMFSLIVKTVAPDWTPHHIILKRSNIRKRLFHSFIHYEYSTWLHLVKKTWSCRRIRGRAKVCYELSQIFSVCFMDGILALLPCCDPPWDSPLSPQQRTTALPPGPRPAQSACRLEKAVPTAPKRWEQKTAAVFSLGNSSLLCECHEKKIIKICGCIFSFLVCFLIDVEDLRTGKSHNPFTVCCSDLQWPSLWLSREHRCPRLHRCSTHHISKQHGDRKGQSASSLTSCFLTLKHFFFTLKLML